MGAESPTVSLGRHGLPLIPLCPPPRGAQREVITLSPNRKPHQKRIMFLHKPVKERAAKPDPLQSITDDLALCTHTHTHTHMQHKAHNYCKHTERFWLRRRLNFWLQAPSLLTFDPSLEGKTPQSPPQDQVRGRRPGYISGKPERDSVLVSRLSDAIHDVDRSDLC